MLLRKIKSFATKTPSRGFHFPTTHVGKQTKKSLNEKKVITQITGSLPRPPSVLTYLKDRKDEAIPPDILETAVRETVQKQIEVC